jgi:hypothetical protein
MGTFSAYESEAYLLQDILGKTNITVCFSKKMKGSKKYK